MIHRYFAFGSNMSSPRMQARIPGARAVGTGKLEGWAFACNKSGMDGSAKANVRPCAGAVVWGVVYELPASELHRLDVIEGGYERVQVEVIDEAGIVLECWAYTSDRLTVDERPFDWYRALIIEGAEEHGLPATYVTALQTLPARPSVST